MDKMDCDEKEIRQQIMGSVFVRNISSLKNDENQNFRKAFPISDFRFPISDFRFPTPRQFLTTIFKMFIFYIRFCMITV